MSSKELAYRAIDYVRERMADLIDSRHASTDEVHMCALVAYIQELENDLFDAKTKNQLQRTALDMLTIHD